MSHSNDDDRVGYGRPPRHTRFKPGQSGNPRGRPRPDRSFTALIEQELEAPVVVSSARGKVTVPARQALAMRIVNEAIKGNVRHIQLLERLLGEEPPQPFQASPGDEATLHKLLRGFASPAAQALVDLHDPGPPQDGQGNDHEGGSDAQP